MGSQLSLLLMAKTEIQQKEEVKNKMQGIRKTLLKKQPGWTWRVYLYVGCSCLIQHAERIASIFGVLTFTWHSGIDVCLWFCIVYETSLLSCSGTKYCNTPARFSSWFNGRVVHTTSWTGGYCLVSDHMFSVQLLDVTCHMTMRSHSLTCYLTQVTTPHSNPSLQAGTRFT